MVFSSIGNPLEYRISELIKVVLERNGHYRQLLMLERESVDEQSSLRYLEIRITILIYEKVFSAIRELNLNSSLIEEIISQVGEINAEV